MLTFDLLFRPRGGRGSDDQAGNLGGVNADGFHVVEDKVDLGELRADGRVEVVLNAPQDRLGCRLLGEVVPVGVWSRVCVCVCACAYV